MYLATHAPHVTGSESYATIKHINWHVKYAYMYLQMLYLSARGRVVDSSRPKGSQLRIIFHPFVRGCSQIVLAAEKLTDGSLRPTAGNLRDF